jgi:hypothetical protein
MLQTRLSDFSEFRTKEEIQLTELGTIKVGGNNASRAREKTQCDRLRDKNMRNDASGNPRQINFPI